MVKLVIEASAEEFEAGLNAAYNKNKNKISVPGFRKGKAPRKMIEQLYGSQIFFEDAANEIIPDAYADAAKESGLDIVSQPKVSIEQLEAGKPFIFAAEVAVRPEVELGEYKGVEVTKADAEVTDADVEEELKKVQDQNSRTVSVEDRAVKDGDMPVIDFEGFKKQVQRMIDGGVQALLVNGTTGETATITIEDEFKLLDLTLELAKGTGVKVICGAGSNDTQTALKKARYAKEKGADAILVVTPYYNKTSQRGLIQHYTTIADAVDIPMILYNVPGRTGLNISVDTVVELAKHKNIQAMKDATDNIAYAMEVLAKTADLDFDLYSGCDDNILPFMAAGGKGVISVTSNLYPEVVEKLTQLILKGNIKEAQPLAYALDPISRLLFIDVNPIMPKAALAKMGVCGEHLRLPLITTTDENKKALFDAMDEFEKLGY